MKYLKKIGLVGLASLAAISISSCGGDEEEIKTYEAEVINEMNPLEVGQKLINNDLLSITKVSKNGDNIEGKMDGEVFFTGKEYSLYKYSETNNSKGKGLEYYKETVKSIYDLLEYNDDPTKEELTYFDIENYDNESGERNNKIINLLRTYDFNYLAEEIKDVVSKLDKTAILGEAMAILGPFAAKYFDLNFQNDIFSMTLKPSALATDLVDLDQKTVNEYLDTLLTESSKDELFKLLATIYQSDVFYDIFKLVQPFVGTDSFYGKIISAIENQEQLVSMLEFAIPLLKAFKVPSLDQYILPFLKEQFEITSFTTYTEIVEGTTFSLNIGQPESTISLNVADLVTLDGIYTKSGSNHTFTSDITFLGQDGSFDVVIDAENGTGNLEFELDYFGLPLQYGLEYAYVNTEEEKSIDITVNNNGNAILLHIEENDGKLSGSLDYDKSIYEVDIYKDEYAYYLDFKEYEKVAAPDPVLSNDTNDTTDTNANKTLVKKINAYIKTNELYVKEEKTNEEKENIVTEITVKPINETDSKVKEIVDNKIYKVGSYFQDANINLDDYELGSNIASIGNKGLVDLKGEYETENFAYNFDNKSISGNLLIKAALTDEEIVLTYKNELTPSLFMTTLEFGDTTYYVECDSKLNESNNLQLDLESVKFYLEGNFVDKPVEYSEEKDGKIVGDSMLSDAFDEAMKQDDFKYIEFKLPLKSLLA